VENYPRIWGHENVSRNSLRKEISTLSFSLSCFKHGEASVKDSPSANNMVVEKFGMWGASSGKFSEYENCVPDINIEHSQPNKLNIETINGCSPAKLQ
jgi:hypothetical protein